MNTGWQRLGRPEVTGGDVCARPMREPSPAENSLDMADLLTHNTPPIHPSTLQVLPRGEPMAIEGSLPFYKPLIAREEIANSSKPLSPAG